MTSRGNEEIAVETLQAGAASYIPKRRLPGQLLPTLQKVIEASGAATRVRHLFGLPHRSEYNFVLNNDSRLFWPLVVYMQESLAHLGMDNATERTRVGMAMAEAWPMPSTTAIWKSSSAIQEQDDAAYDTLLEQRLHQPPYCDRHVHVSVKLCRSEAVFTIRDEGPGFDPSSLPDPTDPANLERVSGRGLLAHLCLYGRRELQFPGERGDAREASGHEPRPQERRKWPITARAMAFCRGSPHRQARRSPRAARHVRRKSPPRSWSLPAPRSP